jgi:hypothetical protein
MRRRALAGTKKALGVEHPDTLSGVDALALVLQDQGKYKAAEEMNRRAPAGGEKVLGRGAGQLLSAPGPNSRCVELAKLLWYREQVAVSMMNVTRCHWRLRI